MRCRPQDWRARRAHEARHQPLHDDGQQGHGPDVESVHQPDQGKREAGGSFDFLFIAFHIFAFLFCSSFAFFLMIFFSFSSYLFSFLTSLSASSPSDSSLSLFSLSASFLSLRFFLLSPSSLSPPLLSFRLFSPLNLTKKHHHHQNQAAYSYDGATIGRLVFQVKTAPNATAQRIACGTAGGKAFDLLPAN